MSSKRIEIFKKSSNHSKKNLQFPEKTPRILKKKLRILKKKSFTVIAALPKWPVRP
jgi:hypothetical protein